MRMLINKNPQHVIRELPGESEQVYRDNFGYIATPSNMIGVEVSRDLDIPWAADNECYSGFKRDYFLRMLKRLRGLPNCKFVTAPDIPFDAITTWRRFLIWSPVIRYYGYPVGLVAQTGMESMDGEWDKFDALFIGGDTDWKLGESAAKLAREAKARGKWLHMGRVNTNRRIRYAQALGCDSADGSGFSRFSKTSIQVSLSTIANATMPLWEGKVLE